MKNFNLPIHNNPLKDKKDLQEAFKQLTDPLKPLFSKENANIHIGNTSAGYPDYVAGMEGFSRVLWGLAPLSAGGAESDLWETYLQGIKNGTNPSHEEYWGIINDYDQRMVEMAAFGLALALVPEKIWEPLNEKERENLSAWLLQINEHKIYGCNWMFFLVMVNMGLKKVGAAHDDEKVEEALNLIEEYYIGQGWYADGKNGHSDYYVPFAIHYYSLVYSKIMEKEDPKRSKIYKERALLFAKDFVHWFAEDGSAIPYGRSQTYRFAQAAFWSALAFSEVEVFTPGIIKGIIMRNLRWWFKQPIFNSDGTLSIGYAYPNLIMAETYNSPGSPYWALKTFLPLCLQDKHSFWTAEEEQLPELEAISVQLKPHMVICKNERDKSLLAFNSGHLTTNDHTHTSAKYEKFVYSNVFGFSVPRAEWGLGQGAFDSMLALSEEDNIYRVKRLSEETEIEGDVIYSKWKPWRDVEVKSYLVAGNPWHFRIHLINTARTIDTAEGGFAVGIENVTSEKVNFETSISDKGSFASSICGTSSIINLYGERKSELIFPNSNTNLIYSRTIIPTLTGKLTPGKHIIVSAFFGTSEQIDSSEIQEEIPQVEINENEIAIILKNKIIFKKQFYKY
jgi:hypothetical protein